MAFRVQNVDSERRAVSLEIPIMGVPGRAHFRRRVVLAPLRIEAGAVVDLCEAFEVSEEGARYLAARVPLSTYLRRGTLRVLPDRASMAAFVQPNAPVSAPLLVEYVPAPPPPPPPPKAPPPPPVEAAPADPTRPSMQWTEEELRAYAAECGHDVSRCRSKTTLLRSILRQEAER